MSHQRASILVVDDQSDNLRSLSAILRTEGYKVRQAVSGEMALDTVRSQRPDLILLDIKMPLMDGYAVCSTLKASAATCEIPIIFLSALDETADKVKGFALGGADYITKPFQAEEVIARVENHLRISRLSKQLAEQNARLTKEIQIRQIAEAALKESEARLKLALEATQTVCWERDLTTDRILLSSPLADSSTSLELSYLEVLALIHPDDRNQVHQVTQEAIATRSSFEIEHRVPVEKQPFKWKWVLAKGNVLVDETGKPTRLIGVSVDISDRKLAEARERAKTQQLKQTLKQLKRTQAQLIQTEKMSSLGRMVAGVAHEINNPVGFIYANIAPAMEYAEELLKLMQLYAKYYPDPVAEISQQLEVVEPDFIAEDFPKLLTSMKDGAERITQIVLSLRNFSRLDQSECKQVDIHEGINSTLNILGHRLKPKCDCPEIQVIKKYGQLPLVECYPGQLNQVFMNIISNAIDAIASRLLADAASAVANANDALREIHGSWYPFGEASYIIHASSESRSHDRAIMNYQQCCNGQVVSNVATIALATMSYEQLPTIRIHTEIVEPNRVAIRIADNGSGIKSEILPQIFEPFFTTKSVGSGTGLGLSISYQVVVNQHGGQLTCHSTPEQGTEFVIELPIAQGKTSVTI